MNYADFFVSSAKCQPPIPGWPNLANFGVGLILQSWSHRLHGFDCHDSKAWLRINKKSLDIVGGVHVGKDNLDVGAGDRGTVFRWAAVETEEARRRRLCL